MYNIDYKSSVI